MSNSPWRYWNAIRDALLPRRRPSAAKNKARRSRPSLEMLEDRLVPSTIPVSSIADTNDPGTLRSAVKIANDDARQGISDNIIILPSIKAQTFRLTQGPLELNGVGGSIEIVDVNHNTIDAGNNSSVFEVKPNVDAVIVGLTLTGGKAQGIDDGTGNITDGGGAINNFGSLKLVNANVTGNNGNSAGAIENNGNLTLTGSSVSNNTGMTAGGIENRGSLTVDSTTISQNTGTFGGAIDNHNSVEVVHGSSLLKNSADTGGAIDNEGTLKIADSVLDGNRALFGGAISNGGANPVQFTNNGPKVTVATTTLDNAYLGDNFATFNGGAIDNTSGSVQVTNGSLIVRNNALLGGGIANEANGDFTKTDLSLTDAFVQNNSAHIGGGVCNAQGNPAVFQLHVTWSGNTADSGADIGSS
jgi:hypothetical protein